MTNGEPAQLPSSGNGSNPGDLKTQFDAVVTKQTGRAVGVLVAFAVPVITGLCAWLQRKFGVKLDPAELTGFITSIALGIALTGFKWLENRGRWETEVLKAYQIYLTGENATKQ